MNKLTQPKKDIKTMFVETFMETDEERASKKYDRYRIEKEEDISRLLSSNLSYREKIKLLNLEKERVSSMKDKIEQAEYDFRNTDIYANKMEKRIMKLLRNLEIEIPCAICGFTAGSITYAELFKYLDTHRLSDLEIYQSIPCFLGTVIAPIVTLYYSYHTVKDLEDYSKYEKELRSYQRRLKNKRQ